MGLKLTFNWKPVLGSYANSVDPAQIPQNAASDQGIRCLLAGISWENTLKVKASTRNP